MQKCEHFKNHGPRLIEELAKAKDFDARTSDGSGLRRVVIGPLKTHEGDISVNDKLVFQ